MSFVMWYFTIGLGWAIYGIIDLVMAIYAVDDDYDISFKAWFVISKLICMTLLWPLGVILTAAKLISRNYRDKVDNYMVDYCVEFEENEDEEA